MTPTTIPQIEQWLWKALPGDQLVYHVGNLAVDRMVLDISYSSGKREVSERWLDAIHIPAERMMDLSARGEVFLVQRRVTPTMRAYIAIRR